MTEYFINCENQLHVSDNVKLLDIIKEVGNDDQLIITMDGNDAAQSDYITDFLRKNGFDVMPKGGHDDNSYHLIAYKKK
ncbi:MAG: hypothetical protein ACOYVK_06655 [Bacillota bacterium]